MLNGHVKNSNCPPILSAQGAGPRIAQRTESGRWRCPPVQPCSALRSKEDILYILLHPRTATN